MRISDWSSDVCSSDLLKVSLTVSLRCAKSSLRCQLRTAALPQLAGVRLAVAENAPLLPGVTVIDEVLGAHWPMTRPPFSKRTTLWVSVPCWMPLWIQMFSVTASQSLANRVDRKSVVEGKSVSRRVDLGGRSIIQKKKDQKIYNE